MSRPPKDSNAGFTLIELSIVLVVIGLLVGGVLVGRDLISAAAIRAQISQIEKYQQAVNAFRGKYEALPGDISGAKASQFGFVSRDGRRARGDENGVLEGGNTNGTTWYGTKQGQGETSLLWVDLSYVGLIDGSFNTATSSTTTGNISGSALALYFPPTKMASQNSYVYAYSGGVAASPWDSDGNNYFGISSVLMIRDPICTGPALTVKDAYNIDSKIDDGLPLTGRVTVLVPNCYGGYPAIFAASGNANTYGTLPGASPASAGQKTCFDDGNNASNPDQYSMGYSNGAGFNCQLSFKFQ